ncbi:MAG: hypothetical protein K6F86_09235 [Lachnospiraceae bacterium]|nr:hypothetical protein [Lachnospiraceae bacterium]
MTVILGAWILLLTLASAFLTAEVLLRGSRIYLAFSFLDLIICFMALQQSVEAAKRGTFGSFAVIPFICLTVICAAMAMHTHMWRKNHLSPMSLKEGLDVLSDGLCYYHEDGRIIFSNPAMNRIAKDLTGAFLTDGRQLWESASKDALQTGGDEGVIVKMPQDHVYRMIRNMRDFLPEPVYELVACDMTEEYDLKLKLEEQNRRLSEQKKILQEINETITDLTIEREILQTKVNIHDDLGKALIAVRSYLSGKTERDELVSIMDKAVSLLGSGDELRRPDDLKTVLRAASDVGVTVRINGLMPVDENKRSVIVAALRECITNTFRHAKGDELYADIRVTENGQTEAVFTNNGAAPEEEIAETGGLGYLRRIAEDNGAQMHIESRPEFMLRKIM